MSLSNWVSGDLSKYKNGSFKEFLYIVIPCTVALLSGILMNSCDRFLVSYCSYQEGLACSIAGYQATLFQVAINAFAFGSQVYVGRYFGAQEYQNIGCIVWQMIWFVLLTYPLFICFGYLCEYIFLASTELHSLGSSYFWILVFANPLFGLNAILAGFFIARGKTKINIIVTLLALILNLVLDVCLIFGVDNWISPMGINGAAIATVIAQFFSFSIFFYAFLRKKNDRQFKTRDFNFNFDELLKGLKISFPKSMMMVSYYIIGMMVTRVMTNEGGSYLEVVSLTIIFSMPFVIFGMGLKHGLIAIVSYLLGKDKNFLIVKILKNAFIYILSIYTILSLPLVFFSKALALSILGDSANPEKISLFINCLIGAWLITFIQSFSAMLGAMLTAHKDTMSQFFITHCLWITSFLPLYLAVSVYHFSYYVYYPIYIFAFLVQTFLMGYQLKRIHFTSKQISDRSPEAFF